MRTNKRLLNEQYSAWLEELLQGKNVAYIRIHLKHFHVEPCLRDDFYQKVADRFRHNYSRAFSKGVRKTGVLAEMIIHLHKIQGSHSNDAPHLHSLAAWKHRDGDECYLSVELSPKYQGVSTLPQKTKERTIFDYMEDE